MKVLTFANTKGGVGKSTTAQAVAAILRNKGYKVLVIDCDYQCNTTFIYDDIKAEDRRSRWNVYDVFTGRASLQEAISKMPLGDIVLSDEDLTDTNRKIERHGSLFLREKINELKETEDYDYIVIDTSPNTDKLLETCLCASDYVITVLDGGNASIRRAMALDELVGRLNEQYNIAIKFAGILFNKYDRRLNTYRECEERCSALKEVNMLHADVFKTRIPQGNAAVKADMYMTTVIDMKGNSKVKEAYLEFTDELLEVINNE